MSDQINERDEDEDEEMPGFFKAVSLATIPAYLAGKFFGEFAGAAFLPEDMMDKGPLIVSALFMATVGAAIGFNRYALVGAGAFLAFVVAGTFGEFDVEVPVIDALLLAGAVLVGAVLSWPFKRGDQY